MAREDDWYQRFWDGALLIPGWRARSDEVLRSVSRDERDAVAEKLSRLGEAIGREWARENSVRRIDNARLEGWGARLREAPAGSLVSVLDEIEGEVRELLV